MTVQAPFLLSPVPDCMEGACIRRNRPEAGPVSWGPPRGRLGDSCFSMLRRAGHVRAGSGEILPAQCSPAVFRAGEAGCGSFRKERIHLKGKNLPFMYDIDRIDKKRYVWIVNIMKKVRRKTLPLNPRIRFRMEKRGNGGIRGKWHPGGEEIGPEKVLREYRRHLEMVPYR